MNNKRSYPKSAHGKQCLGPCHENTWVIHPITLEYAKNQSYPICATEEWIDKKGDHQLYDKCYNVTPDNDDIVETVKMNIIMPQIVFNCKHFLKFYYKITSFEDALMWINDNKHTPLYTRLRIIECTWRSYGKTSDVINDQLVNIYIELIKKQWIRYLYNEVKHYIKVDGDKILFGQSDDDSKHKVEKINFIINKVITENNIYKFLNRYIVAHLDDWDSIESHNDSMLKFFIKYFKSKIKESQ